MTSLHINGDKPCSKLPDRILLYIILTHHLYAKEQDPCQGF